LSGAWKKRDVEKVAEDWLGHKKKLRKLELSRRNKEEIFCLKNRMVNAVGEKYYGSKVNINVKTFVGMLSLIEKFVKISI
jgi:hypothetical protein